MSGALQHFLAVYGYVALFPLAIVEGPIATVFAAFLAARGTLDVTAVFVVVVCADLVGDLLYYGAGRAMSERLTIHGHEQPGEWRWLNWLRRRVEVLGPRIRDGAGPVLLFGKLTHSAGFAVLMAAGAAKVPLRTFLGYNLLATLAKSALLMVTGYWFGHLYTTLGSELKVASVVMFVLAGGGLLVLANHLAGDAEPPTA